MDRLTEQIERLRGELYRLAQARGTADRSVVEVSQQLDRLILEWYRLRTSPLSHPRPVRVPRVS